MTRLEAQLDTEENSQLKCNVLALLDVFEPSAGLSASTGPLSGWNAERDFE